MCGLGVVEPHDVIAALRNPRRARGFRRLGGGGHRQECHHDSRDEFAFHTLSSFVDRDSAHHKRARAPDNSRMLRFKLVAAPLSLLIWASYVLIVILWTPLVFFYRLATLRSDPDRYRLGRFFRKSAVLAGDINSFWRFRIVDHVHPDPRRPYVFVANHCSSEDAFLIARLPWEMKWLSKQSIMRIPLLGWQMRTAGDVPVIRGDKESGRHAQRRWNARAVPGGSVPAGDRGERGRRAARHRGHGSGVAETLGRVCPDDCDAHRAPARLDGRIDGLRRASPGGGRPGRDRPRARRRGEVACHYDGAVSCSRLTT